LPKLPEVPPCKPLVILASLAVVEPSGHDVMPGVEPSAPIDLLPPPIPTSGPFPSIVSSISIEEILAIAPFP